MTDVTPLTEYELERIRKVLTDFPEWEVSHTNSLRLIATISDRDRIIAQAKVVAEQQALVIKKLWDQTSKPLPIDVLLNERDKFIVKNGLWQEFVDQLPNTVYHDFLNANMLAMDDERRKMVTCTGVTGYIWDFGKTAWIMERRKWVSRNGPLADDTEISDIFRGPKCTSGPDDYHDSLQADAPGEEPVAEMHAPHARIINQAVEIQRLQHENALLRRDILAAEARGREAERARLRPVLQGAARALREAEDKFHVFYCNARNPVGEDLTSKHLRQDREMMAKKRDVMGDAAVLVEQAICERG